MTIPDLTAAVTAAIKYADANDIEVPLDIRAEARRLGAIKAGENMTEINRQYHDTITQSLITFFERKRGSIAAPKNQYRRAVVDAFGAAFDLGWTDGGQPLPPNRDAINWYNARIFQEFGHIDVLFEQAKELRKEKDFDYFGWATARADGYTNTLRSVYNMGRLFAMGNKMLTFVGEDGDENHICQSINGTCVQLKGQRHRASWWIAHDLMPYPGNENYDCGGWRCQHGLADDQGERITI